MKSTTVRKLTTLGVGLSLLAGGLATAGPASAAGVASTSVKVNTATTLRAVVNATATAGASSSATAVVRVRPKVVVVAGVRTLAVSIKPAARVKIKLQKKVGTRYVNVRTGYTSTRGTAKFTKLTKGAYYRVYVYASRGRNAVYSGAARVRSTAPYHRPRFASAG